MNSLIVLKDKKQKACILKVQFSFDYVIQIAVIL